MINIRVARVQETSNFHFHNANPKGKNANDCTARAISVALSQSWEQTIREMTELGIKMGLVFNEQRLIDKYLEEKGWIKHKEPRDLNNKKITVESFLKRHPKEMLIMNVGSHHIAIAVDGVVWDTWNCTKKTMHSYWSNSSAAKPKIEEVKPENEKRRFVL